MEENKNGEEQGQRDGTYSPVPKTATVVEQVQNSTRWSSSQPPAPVNGAENGSARLVVCGAVVLVSIILILCGVFAMMFNKVVGAVLILVAVCLLLFVVVPQSKKIGGKSSDVMKKYPNTELEELEKKYEDK